MTQIQAAARATSAPFRRPRSYHPPRMHQHARHSQSHTRIPARSHASPLQVTKRGPKTSARWTTTRLHPHPPRPSRTAKPHRPVRAPAPNPCAGVPLDAAAIAPRVRCPARPNRRLLPLPLPRRRQQSRFRHSCSRGLAHAAACERSRRTTTGSTSRFSYRLRTPLLGARRAWPRAACPCPCPMACSARARSERTEMRC